MNLLLTISLLAANRVHSLERCLDSLKPLLQKVPSELIVVFTGTDERVRETAARYTDQIIPFAWCDDFSKARNAGLSQAKGEWFLYIDDDEWFDDVEELCTFFLSGEYQNYASAFYIQRNYLDWEGTKQADFSAFRMARRVPELAFQNPIHEELVPGNGPYKCFQTVVHHYGYIRDPKQGAEKKQDRNIPLLLKDIRERPKYLKNYLQITKEYFIKKDWAEADIYCRKGLALCGETDVNYKKWLLVYLARISCKLHTAEYAAAEIQQILEKESPCELVSLILDQLLIGRYMELGEYEEALACGQRYAAIFSHMETTPELWETQSYGDITKAEVTDPERLLSVWLNGTTAALEKRDSQSALFFLNHLPWTEEFRMQQYYPLFDRWKDVYGALARDLFLKLPGESAYLLLQRLLLEPGNAACFLRCAEKIEHPYLLEQVLREGMLQKADVCVLLPKMDLRTWEELIEKVVKELPYSEQGLLWDCQVAMMERFPLQGFWFQKQLLEKELFQGYFVGNTFLEKLEEYCQCILSYYHRVFPEALQDANQYLLPAVGRYAVLALKALEALGQGEQPAAVRLLREGLHFYPRMTGVTRELMRQLSKMRVEISESVNEEFQQLATQLKAALSKMIERKQYVEAEAIVRQLSSLLPDDLEFLRLRQQLFRKMS